MISWDPWRHLREWYPDVQVHETKLPWPIQGCIDFRKRIIWLDCRLTSAQRRSALAYELGYLELAPVTPDGGGADQVNDWASRLLVPFDDLLRCCQESDSLESIAAELQVDVPMLRARLRGLSDQEQALVGVDRWHVS